MLTFKHVFNSKKRIGYLGLCHGKSFLPPLISNKLLEVRDGTRIRDQPALPLPSQNSVQVQVCMRTVLSKRRKEESPNAHISQYIYRFIYILHITHFIWTT